MQPLARYALLIVAACPTLLGAQGFGIFEQNTCTMGRGGTAAGAPCADGSAIFFNPAGIAGLKGGHLSLGVTLIDVMGGFTDDQFQQKTDLNNPLLAVPQAYATYSVTPKLGVGIGLFAPYGLETQWPLSFAGRFAGYRNVIRTFYVQPTVAYQVTAQLSLGAGVDIVHGNVELHQRLDLSQAQVPGLPLGTTFGAFGIPLGTDFADADLEASTTSVGAHFGALFKINDRLSIGAHYLTQVTMNYSGTAHFTQDSTHLTIPATLVIPASPKPDTIPAGTSVDQLLGGLGVFSTGGPLADQTAAASIPNPDMLVVGVAYKARNDVTLLFDYQWTHWSAFSVLQLTFSSAPNETLYENYGNTNGFRFGAEWAQSAHVTLRGGYLHHNGAAPPQTVTPLLPEGDRNEFSAGASFHFTGQLSADVAYQYIRQNDRRGRTVETPNIPPTTALNDGLYTFAAHLFGVSLAYTF